MASDSETKIIVLALVCTPLVVVGLYLGRRIERWCYRVTYRWMTGEEPWND